MRQSPRRVPNTAAWLGFAVLLSETPPAATLPDFSQHKLTSCGMFCSVCSLCCKPCHANASQTLAMLGTTEDDAGAEETTPTAQAHGFRTTFWLMHAYAMRRLDQEVTQALAISQQDASAQPRTDRQCQCCKDFGFGHPVCLQHAGGGCCVPY